MTREQAQALVKQAQDKAAADAAAQALKDAAQAKEDEGAVRVPYVPQIVKDEISKQVAEEVKPGVVKDVIQEAKTEKWGRPGSPSRMAFRRQCLWRCDVSRSGGSFFRTTTRISSCWTSMR